KRASRSASRVNSSGRTFSATSRPRRVSRAFHTTPMPPWPSFARTWYGPMAAPGPIVTPGPGVSPDPKAVPRRSSMVIGSLVSIGRGPGLVEQRLDPRHPVALERLPPREHGIEAPAVLRDDVALRLGRRAVGQLEVGRGGGEDVTHREQGVARRRPVRRVLQE